MAQAPGVEAPARRDATHRGQRGAETLEFLGVLPLLAVVVLMVAQGLSLVRQQAEADTDARTLARQAVICHSGDPLVLWDIDKAPGTGVATQAGPYVRVTVTLRPQSLFSSIDLSRLGFPPPRATVTMRHEPC